MTFLVLICIGAVSWLLPILRRDRVSLGLPVAYMFSLLLIHVPGAFAHVVGGDSLSNSDLTELSMRFTAAGSLCFVAGVWLARSFGPSAPVRQIADRSRFWWFCLFGGWLVVYALTPLRIIPSVGAVVDKGAAIWILGVMLGLRAALQRPDGKRVVVWLLALMVYPVVMLLLGGFISYGAGAVIIACSALTVSVRSYWHVLVGITFGAFLSLSIFVTYFQHRGEIREQVWGGAPLDARLSSVSNTLRDFQWLDLSNQVHLNALDARLNQNYFVGLAAQRIQEDQVGYLWGRSLWEGLISLVPRAIWPEKPVFGGSPLIVSEMTGLELSPTTSFGVGNVMEFQINFGLPGVVVGFLALGWLLGKLDYGAAHAYARGDLGRVFLYFLPGVALIQPNGSMVELFGGAAAALVGGMFWKRIWDDRVGHRGNRMVMIARRKAGRTPRTRPAGQNLALRFRARLPRKALDQGRTLKPLKPSR